MVNTYAVQSGGCRFESLWGFGFFLKGAHYEVDYSGKTYLAGLQCTLTSSCAKKNTSIAEFKIMSPEEAKELKPLNTAALKVLTEDDSEDAIVYINELLKTSDKPSNKTSGSPPDNPGDPNTDTPIKSRILREIKELEEIQKLNPTNNAEEREAFLENFNWDDSQLTEDDKNYIEEILIEFNDIFARHRLDMGINHDFKIKLTPKTDEPVYSQELPCPINLQEDLKGENWMRREEKRSRRLLSPGSMNKLRV